MNRGRRRRRLRRDHYIIRNYFGNNLFVFSIVQRVAIQKRKQLVVKSLDIGAPRVTAHTIDGVPCILNNLSRHEGDLTMPSWFRVRDVLNQGWIRGASKEEKDQDGKWFRPLEFWPGAVIHSNGTVIAPGDTMGLLGDHITVLQQPPVATSQTVPCADVEDVSTPPTPPPELR